MTMMTIVFGILFGAVGGVYIALGRKNYEPTYLVTGVALIFYPYFFSNAIVIVIIGAILTAIPIGRAKGWW